MTVLQPGLRVSSRTVLRIGIALLGVVTATLASWLLERIAERDGAGEDRDGPGEPGPRADPPGGSSVSSGP